MKFAINYEEIAYYFNVAFHLAYESTQTDGDIVFFQGKKLNFLERQEKIQHLGMYSGKSKVKNFILSGEICRSVYGDIFDPKNSVLMEDCYCDWLDLAFSNGCAYGDSPTALGLVNRNMPYGNVASMGERLGYTYLGTSYEFKVRYIDLSPLEFFFPFYNSNGIFGDSIEDLEERIIKANPHIQVIRGKEGRKNGIDIHPEEYIHGDLFPPTLDVFTDRLAKECGGVLLDGMRPDYNKMDRMEKP